MIMNHSFMIMMETSVDLDNLIEISWSIAYSALAATATARINCGPAPRGTYTAHAHAHNIHDIRNNERTARGLPADKPWDVVSVTRRSSGVAPRACVRVYARVLVPPNLYIHTHILRAVRARSHTV